MNGGTHALAGALCGLLLTDGGQTWGGGTAAAVAVGAIAALAPDLDHPRAALSVRLGLIAAPVRLFVRHRGALHSPLAALAVLATAIAIRADLRLYGLVAAAGYASHIALDALTVQGVPLLWPLRQRFRLIGITTGGFWELLVMLAMVGAAAWLVMRRI